VVPSYNRASLIPATLKSLQFQFNKNYEIIVVDDGSTDNTEDVVLPFLNDYTRYIKKENAERAAARNFGANLARGRYVNFFDSDDLALPNHTNEAAAMIGRNDDPIWFHLAFEWITPNGELIRQINHFKGHTLNKQIASGNLLSCNGVFIRRDIFLQNQFNEDRVLSASEDYELWLRLSARHPLNYSNTITSQIVDHDMRSVRTINGNKLIDRIERFVKYAGQDPEIMRFYGSDLRYIRMDAWSYVALHLADHPEWKLNSLRFFFRSLGESCRLLATKRFYAIIKNWLLKW
jgi:glycosyltransferase involved in cell wall biosynthesis